MTQTPDEEYEDQDAGPTTMAPDGERPNGPLDEVIGDAGDGDRGDEENRLDETPKPPG